MKKLLGTCVCFFLLLDLHAQSKDSVYLFCYFKGNGDGLHYAYSTDGFLWQVLFNDSIVFKPTAGKDKLFRDPCIIRGRDGWYHLVWTVSWNEKGIGYARSRDLVHWTDQQYLPVMEHEAEARNTWAPEISYDPRRKKYMIYWASTITGRFPSKDTAAESGYNHRMYYTTTRNFRKFKRTKLLYDPGFSVIDATIVQQGERYIMFLKNETRHPEEKNIRVSTATRMEGPYTTPGPPITGPYWAEGPAALQLNGQWIVYFDKYRDHRYGAVVSTDLLHWTDVSDKVIFPRGIRHGTAFAIPREQLRRMQQLRQ